MAFTDKQREMMLQEHGQPDLSIEFDVWGDTKEAKVSMWTHLDHSHNYQTVKNRMIAIRDHLNSFLEDERMCPFYKPDHL